MDRMTHNKASRPPIIALYQPDIPQNTASIIRTCSCFGLKVEIIEPCGFSLEDKRFKRVVMDYYNKKMIKNYMSWSSFINFKTKRNQRVLLLTTKSRKSFLKFKFKSGDTLLFGRESAGVPEILHRTIKDKIKIPMSKKARSLNIAMSVAIVSAEAIRQNNLFNQ